MTYYRDIKELCVFLDLSTYCNAGCPQCDRTDTQGLGKEGWIPNEMWTIDRVKRAYPLGMDIFRATLCSTWGDPMMVKDIDQIIYHFLENGTEVHCNTNGSMRDTWWWFNLGREMSESETPSKMTFDIEGINQEMHAKYRRNTDLNKILENMEAYTLGGGLAQVHTIVFEHNEKYLREIKELCEKHGAKTIQFQKSNRRFDHDNNREFRFINEHGEKDSIRRSTLDISKTLGS